MNCQLKKNISPTEQQLRLAHELKIDPLVIMLLHNRNICSKQDIINFLNPSLTNLPSPDLLQGMSEGISLIVEAIQAQKDIAIWGDYDVDGITGTALLIQFFRVIGKNVHFYIPDRLNEGYGLNNQGLSKLRKEMVSDNPVLITIDCGIANFTEVREAKQLGFTVIVTDHHELPQGKLFADAVINPKKNGNNKAFYNLAGVGVSFYLAAGIRSALNSQNYFSDSDFLCPNMKWFLSFVALGTIADMVPLTEINRILVRGGFEALVTTSHQGLIALLRSCDIHGEMLTTDDIAFTIAPKINAAGRIGRAHIALELLLTNDDKDKSLKLASQLTSINVKRKKITKDVFDQALNEAEKLFNDRSSCIVLEGQYHQGVIGIVASQLVEQFRVPVVIFSRGNEGILKGSGRSVEGVNLFEILQQCEKYTIQYGGHSMAVGLSMFESNFSDFRNILNTIISSSTKGELADRHLEIDLSCSIDKLFSGDLINQLQLMEPYGEGNKQPIFIDHQTEPVHVSTVGKDSGHIKIRFRGKFSNQEGIGFGLGDKLFELREKRIHSVVYSPMLNRFRRSANWQIKILSIN